LLPFDAHSIPVHQANKQNNKQAKQGIQRRRIQKETWPSHLGFALIAWMRQ
jgi:hypothetical protein